MYNTEQKERYLRRQSPRYLNSIELVLRQTEPFENRRELDCSEFNTKEITEMYKEMNVASLDTLSNRNSILKKYTDWCLSESLVADGVNHYDEINYEDIAKCTNKVSTRKKYLTTAEVYRVVDSLLNPLEKVVVLAAFEGVLMNGGYLSVYNMTSDDLDGNVIHLDGGKFFTLSNCIIEYIKQAENASHYIPYNQEGSQRALDGYAFDPNDHYVFKRMYNVPVRYETEHRAQIYFIRTLERIRRECSGDTSLLTIKALNESGRIEAIKQYMEQEGSQDPRATMERHKNELDDRFGYIANCKRYIIKHAECFAEV